MIPNPLRTVLTLAGIVMLLALVIVSISFCQARKDAQRAKAEGRVAEATGKALDTVAKETPVIRQQQEEKQREVDQIQGSDTRLPDGYGDSLQRLRDGKRKDS